MTATRNEATPDLFARQGYCIARGFLEPVLTTYLWNYAVMKVVYQRLRGGDTAVPNSVTRYGDDAFEALLETVRPRVEAVTGYRLFPTYSYFRMYLRGNALGQHRDGPACEISVSLNLGQSPERPWPLCLEGREGEISAALHPGDALVYKGAELTHWREPYEGAQLGQVFLHYVDKNGPYADRKFDGRGRLMSAEPAPADKAV